MCGRYATSRSAVDLRTLFEAEDETDDGLAPDYNIAPTDPVPIVRNSQRSRERSQKQQRVGRVLSIARWGLVPPWSKDTRGAARMINARVETVATARAYATSFARRRCLVPADGWYEWQRLSVRDRQAYFMTPRNGDVLAFAGLWTVWGDQRLLTTTIITVPAVGDFSAVHDRMPLVLEPDRWSDWLTAEPSERTDLLVPPGDAYLSTMDIRPVGPQVGDVRNDGPDLIKPVPAPPLGSAPPTFTDLTLF